MLLCAREAQRRTHITKDAKFGRDYACRYLSNYAAAMRGVDSPRNALMRFHRLFAVFESKEIS